MKSFAYIYVCRLAVILSVNDPGEHFFFKVHQYSAINRANISHQIEWNILGHSQLFSSRLFQISEHGYASVIEFFLVPCQKNSSQKHFVWEHYFKLDKHANKKSIQIEHQNKNETKSEYSLSVFYGLNNFGR